MNKFEYFNDCEICKAMREAEAEGKDLSLEELEVVFDKQNKKNEKRDSEF